MASLFGQDEDEDEKFKQMLGGIIGQGPAPYDVTTSMEQPEPQQLSAPYMPQSGSTGGLPGYTPPPAAAAPAYLDHVEGHQFGAGDIAMLAGIVAALGLGGKHRGEIAGSLAGQYGGAVMQANGRADQRNQQVDQYNSQLASKDTGLERWKADQQAQQMAGNLKARGDELALQTSREKRIGDAQAAEDAKDPVAEAERIAKARAGVDLETTRQKNDMEVGTREMLGQILGKQRQEYASPTGKGASGMNDPAKALKAKLAQAQLDGIDSGTVDPLTGKPKDKPKTPAQLAAEGKKASRGVPFDGTEVDNEELFNSTMSTDNIREKLRKDDATLAAALPALQDMYELRKANGAETGIGADSGDVTGQYDIANAKVQSALGVLKNIGVISPTEASGLEKTIPGIRPELSDAARILPESWGGGDTKLGKLGGATTEFEKLIARARKSYGLRTKSADAPAEEKDLGTSDSGIKFSADPKAESKFNEGGGSRTVTITYTDGETESFTGTDDQIQKLRGKSAVRSVQ